MILMVEVRKHQKDVTFSKKILKFLYLCTVHKANSLFNVAPFKATFID